MTADSTKSKHLKQPLVWIAYPETTVRWTNQAEGQLEISTPWIKVNAEVDAKHVDVVQNAINAINTKASSDRDITNSNYFLSQFVEYPVAYPGTRSAHFFHSYRFDWPSTTTNVEACPNPEWMSKTGFDSLDTIELLRQTQIVPTAFHDPLTVCGLVRRLRLKKMMENKKIPTLMSELRSLKSEAPAQVTDIMIRLLEHSLFITRHAVSILKEGLGKQERADFVLGDFIASETGHDRLIAKSLHALGAQPGALQTGLFNEVHELTEMLRFAAQTDLLTLACLIEGFEGIHFDNEPSDVWSLLDGLPDYPSAATGVREHQKINKSQNHANICFDIATHLRPATATEATLAVNLSDAAESCRQRLFEKLYSSTGR